MKGKGILDRKGTHKTVRKQETKRATGRDPVNQTFRKFRSKTQWIGSVQSKKFRKNGSTF